MCRLIVDRHGSAQGAVGVAAAANRNHFYPGCTGRLDVVWRVTNQKCVAREKARLWLSFRERCRREAAHRTRWLLRTDASGGV